MRKAGVLFLAFFLAWGIWGCEKSSSPTLHTDDVWAELSRQGLSMKEIDMHSYYTDDTMNRFFMLNESAAQKAYELDAGAAPGSSEMLYIYEFNSAKERAHGADEMRDRTQNTVIDMVLSYQAYEAGNVLMVYGGSVGKIHEQAVAAAVKALQQEAETGE